MGREDVFTLESFTVECSEENVVESQCNWILFALVWGRWMNVWLFLWEGCWRRPTIQVTDIIQSVCFQPHSQVSVPGLHVQCHSLLTPWLQLPFLAELLTVSPFALCLPKMYHLSSVFVFSLDPFLLVVLCFKKNTTFYWYFKKFP